MYQWIIDISILGIGFFIGSLHVPYWYAKKFRGIDLREIGTKSVGASNTMKFFGQKVTYLVALFDFALKGAIPLFLLRYFGCEEWLQLSAGLLIVCGHNWSPFLGFRAESLPLAAK